MNRSLQPLMTSQTPEWYTPQHIIDAVIQVLGYIDLDPCSPPEPSVPCKMYYTEWSDGLSQMWYGKVYMNPPYGRKISKWVEKLHMETVCDNVDEAIALVPARTDTAWYTLLSEYPWCAVRGRLKFSGHENGAPFPSAIFYIGDYPERFAQVFGDIGTIWLPLHWKR